MEENTGSGYLDGYSKAVIDASEMVMPSVVKIDILKTGPGPDASENPEKTLGSGSGMIFTPDGMILTNSHVIHSGQHIEVMLLDGRRFRAHIVGDDPATDMGVIRIDAPDVTFVKFGDSQKLRVG